ncbi:MAG TPA: PGPGW domain-containing protein [Alphaproteobacteria bacterium]|nr:PGPGW domain-containing protein [Alphaproteobacteria bacterium]
MAAQLRRILILILAWLFILLGVAGLFLPFLQGFLFLFVGALLLSRESEIARRHLERLRKRYPSLGRSMDEAEAWIKRQWQRLRGLFR